jgi:ABC-type lipoprotein release transport system permease subunit
LIAVPVAVAVVVAGMFRAGEFTVEESMRSMFGNGDIWVGPSDDPRVLPWLDSTLTEVSPSTQWTVMRSVHTDAIPEVAGTETITDVDPADPLTGPMRVITAGRTPRSGNEVALSPRLAERLGVELGDTVEVEVPGAVTRSMELVGLVGSPGIYEESLITVTPETMDAVYRAAGDEGISVVISDEDPVATAETLAERWEQDRRGFWPKSAVLAKPPELASIPDEIYVYFERDEVENLVETARTEGDDAARDEAFRMVDATARPEIAVPYLNVETRAALSRQQSNSVVESAPSISTGVSALLLLEVAFVAGAAFAAGTRRRLREIGLLGANGASDKHIRLTVLGESLTVGALGALTGIGLGIGVLLAGRPIIQRFVTKLLVGIGVTPLDLVGPAVMAVSAAAVAAWIPARTASRVPTTTALQGRMPAFPPRPWVVPLGLGLAGMGALLLVVALASRADLATVMAVIGGAMALGGTALLAGPILALLSRAADRVAGTSRLVLRDSARHRTRSAVAVAATLVILLIPVVSIAFEATSEVQQRVHGLPIPEDHMLLTGAAPGEGLFGGFADLSEADIDRVAAILPEDAVAPFEVIDVPALIGWEIPISEGEVPGVPGEEVGWNSVAVATPELVEALDHPGLAGALAADGLAVLGVEEGRIEVEVAGERHTVSQLPVPNLSFAMPQILVSEVLAAGFEGERRVRSLFVLGRPLTDSEREAVYRDFDVIGGFRDFTLADLYPLMLGGTLLVVLIVVALVTAVSASEVDHDLGIVVAVGAPGSIRRRFLGVLAGYQTFVAALLAIPLGLGLMKVIGLADDGYWAGPFGVVRSSFVTVPWPALAAIGVLLPLLVAALTSLAVRSAPVTPPRAPT